MSEEKRGNILGLLAFLAFLSFLVLVIWQMSRQSASTVTVSDIQKAREIVRRLEVGG